MSSHATGSSKFMPPRWVIYLVVFMIVTSWVPLAFIARARSRPSAARPIHLFLDMDFQPKYTAQQTSPVFADGRAMRSPVPGTVARSPEDAPDLDDDHYYRGYRTDGDLNPVMVAAPDGSQIRSYFDTMPEALSLTRDLLDRGRARFDIYCSVCHARVGNGNGPVQQRVATILLGDPSAIDGWVQPRNLLDEPTRSYPVGRIFDIATNGFNTMAGYASQVPVEDRWAIAAYVKALQLSQRTPAAQVPADLRDELD